MPRGRMVVQCCKFRCRKPYIPLASRINLIMHEIGFMHRGTNVESGTSRQAQVHLALGVHSNQPLTHVCVTYMNTC